MAISTHTAAPTAEITIHHIHFVNGAAIPTYGLLFRTPGEKLAAPDLSSDLSAVEDLRRRIVDGALSPLHFWDVVEDFLNR